MLKSNRRRKLLTGKSLSKKDNRMNGSLFKKLIIICAVLGFLVGCTTTTVVRDERVSPRRHPELAAAQRHIEIAMDRLSEAQRANDFDMHGHAKKAKELLDEAYVEVKLAAEAANENR